MILPIKGSFLLSVYLLHFASSSDSVFDLFFDQTETRKARSSALYVTLTNLIKLMCLNFKLAVFCHQVILF